MLFSRFISAARLFLQNNFPGKTFNRSASAEALGGKAAAIRIPPKDRTSTRLQVIAGMSHSELYARFDSHASGLTQQVAREKATRVGLNEVAQEKPISLGRHLWQCYCNPFNLLLSALAMVSFLTDDMEAAFIISIMVLVATTMRLIQERRSNQAADKLKAMVSNSVMVFRRDGEQGASVRLNLPIRHLVPGDIVHLSAGDLVAADMRILQAKDLFVSQAALTGESMPVEKNALMQQDAKNPLDAANLCFMGSRVISGTAAAIVVGTGSHTLFGQLAEHLVEQTTEPTQFQLGVNRISWLLIRFMFVMTPVVLFINGFTKGDWVEAALFALSVAVGLTPEMLPMIVTSTLAKGAVVLSRRKVIVKKLEAIQNFGAMDILCTDKTGTLTQDKVALERHTDVWGQPCQRVLELAWLNSHHQTGLKNLLDRAILEHAKPEDVQALTAQYGKIDEIPFDFVRRRMSVVVSDQIGQHQLICKGALDEVLDVCTRVYHDGRVEPLTDELLCGIRAVAGELNREGLRVVAVAYRPQQTARLDYGIADEYRLILAGYIAFLDPPKESAAPALAALKKSGITVKLLTGDNELVTRKVCQEVGLDARDILTGSQIDAMPDDQLAIACGVTQVFARLTPSQKKRLVEMMRAQGHVVGFMGDGINDAPALRAADIGISVDSGVDIAKEAADIILLEKSLQVLEAGVKEGRRTFANMLKYIRMTASSNFGNVFSVLVASAFIPFLPMLPIHLLIQNLLYDISQIAIVFDNVDEDQLSKPQRWNADGLGRFMLFFGPISSIFDIATFALMWYVFGAQTAEQQTLFQSGWFVVGLLSQTLIVHMIRTPKIPFLQSRAALPLILMSLVIAAIGIYLPMGNLASAFSMQALPLDYFPWLAAILVSYMVLTQAMKGFYTRRFGWQ